MTDTITKYRICGAKYSSTAIIPIEVMKETPTTVTIKVENGRGGSKRIRKNSGYHVYCNSWDEARTALMDRMYKKFEKLEAETINIRTQIGELFTREQQ